MRLAISLLSRPHRFSMRETKDSITDAAWSVSRRVGWNALLAISAPSSSTYGMTPRSFESSSRSKTKPAPPIPRSMPWRRASKGNATSSTTLPIAWAPAPANPEPIQGISVSDVESSPLTIITLSHRPLAIQSSAIANAAGVDAQALFIARLGPLAPIHDANWLWPMDKTWRRYFLSNCDSSEEPSFNACSIAFSSPGKTDANITPVRSRSLSGSVHLRITLIPELLVCSIGNKGRPASLRASSPDAKASEVATSKASTSLGSMPYCSIRSKAPPIPASWGTVSNVSAETNLEVPSSLFTRRTILLSTSFCFISAEISEIRFLPARIASHTSSSKTSLIPGTPKDTPLTTGASEIDVSNFSGVVFGPYHSTKSSTTEICWGFDPVNFPFFESFSTTLESFESSRPSSIRSTLPSNTLAGYPVSSASILATKPAVFAMGSGDTTWWPMLFSLCAVGRGLDRILRASRSLDSGPISISDGLDLNSGERMSLPHSSMIGCFPFIERNARDPRNVAMPPTLGWFVVEDLTSSPSISLTVEDRARFGPTSRNSLAPAACMVSI